MEKVVQELAGEREWLLQSQCRHDMGPPALPSVHLSVIGTSAAADEESFRGGGGREREAMLMMCFLSLIIGPGEK